MPDFKNFRNEIIVHPNRSQRSTSTVLYLEPMDSGEPSAASGTLSVEIWRVVRARLHWIVAIIFIGSIAGFVLSLAETPTYVARTSLEIQNPTEAQSTQVGDGAAIAPEAYLPTQVAILESRTLRRRAITRLKKQNFQAGGVAQDQFSKLRRTLHLAPKTAPAISANQALPPITVAATISVNTRIVSISCESPDPRVAAAFANALANEYIDSNLQARWDAINNAREWLAQQLDDSRSKLQKSEDDLQAYGRASNLLFTADKESADQDKLKQLQEELSRAQAARIEKQSSYEMAVSTPADSVPQVIDNPRLGDYEKQLADLRRQLADLTSMYTPEHPKVKQVQAQINELESTFRKERQDVLTQIRSEYQGALSQERLLSSAYRSQVQIVSDQTQKSVNYNILERDVDTNRKMYDTLLEKAHEADIATAMRGSNTRIIDPAEAPVAPAKPNFVWNTLLGSLSGLMVAFGFVAVRESLDRSFKSPGDVPHHLNLPELGVIPEGILPASGQPRLSRMPLGAGSDDILEPSGHIGSVELVTWRDKSSVIAESFRSVVTSILCSPETGTTTRVILVSSAIRAEGKTTIVSNLGIALAEINQKVLLIDGDMRKPRLNEVFGISNDWGLSDLLRESSSLRDCPIEALVQRTEMPQLSILTSGPATNSVSNLLYSHRMLELLQRLRSEFDIILIDTPPMLDISDARILGRLADAAILVFRAGKTSRDAAMAAKCRLTDDGIPVLGTILNAWDVRNAGGYGYSPYQYYSSSPS